MNKAFQGLALALPLALATAVAPVRAAQPPAAAASGAPNWGPGAMAAYHSAYGPGMMGGGGGDHGPCMMAGFGGGYGPGMMAGFGGGYGPGMMGGFGGGYGPGMMGGFGAGYGPGMMAGFGGGSWMVGSNRGAYSSALNDAQVKRIRAIEKATFDRQWALAAKMHDLAFVNVPASGGSRIDVDALMKQATALSNLRLQMLRNRLEAQQKIDAVLDAAQGTKR